MTGVRIVARASGGPLDVPDWTLVDVVLRTARDHGDRPAFLGKDGEVRATWAQAEARVRRVAQALVGLGVRPGDRVGIVADTREEWVVADVAILMVGGVSVSVFRSFPPHAIQDALRHSGVRLAFVEDAEVLAKCGDVLDRAVVMEGAIDPSDKRALAFAALDAEPTPEIDARIAALRADDPAVILYTSGTTGKPKGAVLTHRNLVSNSVAAIRHLQLPPHPIGLAFLPIAHSYMRQAAVVLILLGGSVAFSAPKLMQQDLPRIRPTLLPSVPRLYERAYERIQERVRGMLPHRRAIFRAAVATAREYGRLKMQGAPIPAGLRRKHALFELLVYRKVRKLAGLDRLDLAITGAAAMRADLLQFYWGVGLPIAEGYGLTETAAPSNVNPRHAARPGTVGPPLPGVEIGIAQDGEVLIAGPNVFHGYDRLPAETAESFVELEGKRWLLTGDIGVLEDGYLRIVDRKKELEVLDTGKKVAPLPIEERLKEADLVGEAVVIGHQRKYVGCLLQPAFEALEAFARSRGIPYDASRTRRAAGVTGETGVVEVDPALLEHPEVRAAYAAEVERVNATLASYERIKEFRLLASALSADRGEITPTLKKRRKAILESRRADVDALFIR